MESVARVAFDMSKIAATNTLTEELVDEAISIHNNLGRLQDEMIIEELQK